MTKKCRRTLSKFSFYEFSETFCGTIKSDFYVFINLFHCRRYTTPKRTNTAATSCDTPVQTLRLTTSILRDAYETDAMEWTDRMTFLEEENRALRSLEAENKTLLEEATEVIFVFMYEIISC